MGLGLLVIHWPVYFKTQFFTWKWLMWRELTALFPVSYLKHILDSFIRASSQRREHRWRACLGASRAVAPYGRHHRCAIGPSGAVWGLGPPHTLTSGPSTSYQAVYFNTPHQAYTYAYCTLIKYKATKNWKAVKCPDQQCWEARWWQSTY